MLLAAIKEYVYQRLHFLLLFLVQFAIHLHTIESFIESCSSNSNKMLVGLFDLLYNGDYLIRRTHLISSKIFDKKVFVSTVILYSISMFSNSSMLSL